MQRRFAWCVALATLVIPAEGLAQAGGKYGGRLGGRRALNRKGGRPIAKAISLGLDWLQKEQQPDGRWFMVRDTFNSD